MEGWGRGIRSSGLSTTTKKTTNKQTKKESKLFKEYIIAYAFCGNQYEPGALGNC